MVAQLSARGAFALHAHKTRKFRSTQTRMSWRNRYKKTTNPLTAEQIKALADLFGDSHTPPAEKPLLIARHLGLVGDSLTKQDIARMIGASREMVSRVMKDLVDMGHVSYEGSTIVLHEKLAESAR